MRGRIVEEDIQALRERADLSVIVAEYTSLQHAGGGRLKGLCPFHQEKTPSFTVDPAKGLFHCVAAETGVMTWEGTVPISKLAGGSHRLLTTNGIWVDVEVRSFGVQQLWAVHLSRNGVGKTLHATDGHRWLLRPSAGPWSYRETTTTDLKSGDRLAYSFPNVTNVRSRKPEPFGVAHGFTFGDWTRGRHGCRADFHADKDRDLLRYFPEREIGRAGDGRLCITRLPLFFKDLPRLKEAAAYLYGWLAGYFAADGCVSEDGQVILSSASRENLEYVRTMANRLGIGTYAVKRQIRTGLGTAPKPLHHLTFINSTLNKEFFILSRHRERFVEATGRQRQERKGWVVRAVEPTDRVEEVYCATVPGTHAFTLEDNILTGNCFGCGQGGDVYGFVRAIEALSFPEAVERVAHTVGYELRYAELRPGERKALGRRARLTEALGEAARFYADQLAGPDGAKARSYLASRGVDETAVRRFQLGWAPDRWDELVRHLARHGFELRELADAGLAAPGQRGMIDRFRGRVMFPILDRAGRDVVAFGGRVLPGMVLRTGSRDVPKYINSPESAIYKKSETLYGLGWARAEIVRRGATLVVEGYMDVIGLHLAGARHAVATCGTALTADHFRQLERFAPRVVLALDADDAGFAAADRARRLAEEVGIREVVVLELPGGQDPADLATTGPEAVETALKTAKTAVEFQLEHLLRDADVSTPEAQAEAYRRTFPLLSRIGDRFLRYRYIRDLVAPAVRLSADLIERELDVRGHGGAPARVTRQHQRSPGEPAPSPANRERRASPQAQLERQVLRTALQTPELLPPEWENLAADDFTAPLARELFLAVSAAPPGDLDAVLAAMPDDETRSRVRALALSEPTIGDAGKARKLVTDLVAAGLARRLDEVRAELTRVHEQLDPSERRRLLARELELRRQQDDLTGRARR